jgi:hypothetical protein
MFLAYLRLYRWPKLRFSERNALRISGRTRQSTPKCATDVYRVQAMETAHMILRASVRRHRRILELCQAGSGIVSRMRLPRTRFCRGLNLITIREAIPPPSISKVAQNSPKAYRLSRPLTAACRSQERMNGRRVLTFAGTCGPIDSATDVSAAHWSPASIHRPVMRRAAGQAWQACLSRGRVP